MIADTIQRAEIARLVRELPDLDSTATSQAHDALAELLACFPVYRSYLPAGREQLDRAAAEASARRPDLADDDRRGSCRCSPTPRSTSRADSSRPPVRSWPRASKTPRSTATPGSAR